MGGKMIKLIFVLGICFLGFVAHEIVDNFDGRPLTSFHSDQNFELLTDGQDSNYVKMIIHRTQWGIETPQAFGTKHYICIDGLTEEQALKEIQRIQAHKILNEK